MSTQQLQGPVGFVGTGENLSRTEQETYQWPEKQYARYVFKVADKRCSFRPLADPIKINGITYAALDFFQALESAPMGPSELPPIHLFCFALVQSVSQMKVSQHGVKLVVKQQRQFMSFVL